MATLQAYQAVDFDDLIRLPAQLFERDEEVRERWQNKLRYLLIDEYQDTNTCQYLLLKLLAGPRAAFTAVGDDDQAIYGWRGATLENLKQLQVDFRRSRSSSWNKLPFDVAHSDGGEQRHREESETLREEAVE